MRSYLSWFVLCLFTVSAFAHPNFTGYSGAPGSLGSCAMSCHGSDGGSVSILGFPATYVPGESYTLTIMRITGDSISNFNASVRTTPANVIAGVLSAGTSTAIYSVAAETNGVHFQTPNHGSGTFVWTAPAAGTGTVHLWAGAHQSTLPEGPNADMLYTSHEAPAAPGQATNPDPPNLAVDVATNTFLTWTADTAATSHDVYLGTTLDLALVGTTTEPFYDPPGNLQPGTIYYWRIDERNLVGATTGNLWQFTTLAVPAQATNPVPANGDTVSVSTSSLSWTAGAGAASHDVYFGLTNPPVLQISSQANTAWPIPSLLSDTVYYWRIDERNDAGVTTGVVWHFRTFSSGIDDHNASALPDKLTLGPVYPNPFNATITIPFALPRASDVTVTLYDIDGRQVAAIAKGAFSGGQHAVQWSAENVGSGIYFVRVQAGNSTLTAKVVAMK
jgi:hypothetical protein